MPPPLPSLAPSALARSSRRCSRVELAVDRRLNSLRLLPLLGPPFLVRQGGGCTGQVAWWLLTMWLALLSGCTQQHTLCGSGLPPLRAFALFCLPANHAAVAVEHNVEGPCERSMARLGHSYNDRAANPFTLPLTPSRCR